MLLRKDCSLRILLVIFISVVVKTYTYAQDNDNYEGMRIPTERETTPDSVETIGVPEGIYTWTTDRRFGNIRPAVFDTVPHLFQNRVFTDGTTGHYNFLGNLGSPRQSRVFTERKGSSFDGYGQFVFAMPYDFFLWQPDELQYTNTKSPFTNLTYHECGNKQNGEDFFRAQFATNVNKHIGLGFNLSYLYGRGYYDSQSSSQFEGTVFGSYTGADRYMLHAYYTANHIKHAENGGLENDFYVTSPESFPTKYGTADMPMNLTKSYNKLNVNAFHVTHRYNLGFTRLRDDEGNIVSTLQDRAAARFVAGNADTTMIASEDSDLHTPQEGMKYIPEFIPVISLFHTLHLDHDNRRFMSNANQSVQNNYFKDHFLPADSANDFTRYLHVENLAGIELREGMNKWMRTGIRLFAKHDFYKFTLPREITHPGQLTRQSSTENHFTLGGQLVREQGKGILSYQTLGEIRTTGSTWGEFNVEGNASLHIPLRHDTLHLALDGKIRHELPSYYMRHFHARNAWWDADLNKELRTRIGGEIQYKSTRARFHVEHIQNYAYLQETQDPFTSPEGIARAIFGVNVAQSNSGIQLIEAGLRQDFHWGIFHWDTELTFQATSNQDILPLPALTAWSNVYLQFRIAKVLRTEIGADVRYFTSYYAPAYSPIVGQFAIQDTDARIKVGNYPVVNAYANFHLKRTRFYVMASHVNHSTGNGRPFLVPHYPINRLVLRLGLSWNFIN